MPTAISPGGSSSKPPAALPTVHRAARRECPFSAKQAPRLRNSPRPSWTTSRSPGGPLPECCFRGLRASPACRPRRLERTKSNTLPRWSRDRRFASDAARAGPSPPPAPPERQSCPVGGLHTTLRWLPLGSGWAAAPVFRRFGPAPKPSLRVKPSPFTGTSRVDPNRTAFQPSTALGAVLDGVLGVLNELDRDERGVERRNIERRSPRS